MAARKKRSTKVEPPCAHVELDMLAYMAGLAVGPHAGDHTAILWCVDCGAISRRRYDKGVPLEDRLRLPRRARPA